MRGRDAARLYLAWSTRFRRFLSLVVGLVDGVWMGLLDDEALDAIDELAYGRDSEYVDPQYNNRGLYTWERKAVEMYFPPGGRVAVTGAGAGREVLALSRQGFDVVGYEPNPKLVEQGNRLLEESGFVSRITSSAREGWPGRGDFDAVLVGWGSYHHIRGRRRRLEFLDGARASLPTGGPIVLSFFFRQKGSRYYGAARKVAEGVRRLRRSPSTHPLEVGDALSPFFVHLFTRHEIESELDAAGFSLVAFDTFEYATATATSRGPGAQRGTERHHGS